MVGIYEKGENVDNKGLREYGQKRKEKKFKVGNHSRRQHLHLAPSCH